MTQPTGIIAPFIADREVIFDPSSENNGMYLCLDQAAVDAGLGAAIIEKLSAAGAWHGEFKTISDDKKPVYAEHLSFEEAFAAELNGHSFLVLRAGNPKYPTIKASWDKWRDCLVAA